MARVLKGVEAGEAVGADALGRYLAPGQRAALVLQLSRDVETRADALLAEARRTAAAILAEAEARAGQIRAQAQAEGFAAGHAAGAAGARAEMEETAAVLSTAVAGAGALRDALLEGVEQQAVELALTAARRVVGLVAETHAGLAARIVREGLRAAPGRVLRLHVHPHDVESVTAEVVAQGDDIPVQADVTVAIGGCVIDVEGSTVDLRLDTQLDTIVQALHRRSE